MSRPGTLTTTSYAILGLLAIQPWSSYELTKQMDRSLNRWWPRAQSKLYEEPKKLVEHGLARARSERVGRRPRTTYSITAAGRRALADWLSQPGAGPVLEFEGLLKVFFAEHGSKAAALASLSAAREWAVERNAENLATARAHLAASGPFPERAAMTHLVGAFLTDFYAMVADWADWATSQVDHWPADPREARPDPGQQQRILHRASWSQPGPRGPAERDA